jgi:hypothetical protein
MPGKQGGIVAEPLMDGNYTSDMPEPSQSSASSGKINGVPQLKKKER